MTYRVEIESKDFYKDQLRAIDWAKSNCPSFSNADAEPIQDESDSFLRWAKQTLRYSFDFEDESDATLFLMKWK